jgi:hypothetical protein
MPNHTHYLQNIPHDSPLDFAKRLKTAHMYRPKSTIHAGRYTPTQISSCKNGQRSNNHFAPLQNITLAQVNPMQIFTHRIFLRVLLCCPRCLNVYSAVPHIKLNYNPYYKIGNTRRWNEEPGAARDMSSRDTPHLVDAY